MRLISNEELLVVAGGDFGGDFTADFGDDFASNFDDGFGGQKKPTTPKNPKNPSSSPQKVQPLPTPQQQPSSGWIEFSFTISGGMGTNPNTPKPPKSKN